MAVSGQRIALFLSTSGHSGVDRAIRNLVPALARRGHAVDLLKVRKHGPELHEVPPGVRVLDTGASTTYAALPYLIRYLRAEKPAVLLADKDRVNRTALLARWLAGAKKTTRLVLSSGTTISVDLKSRGAFERWIQKTSMGKLYGYSDQVIVTCEAVADDMSRYTGLVRDHIRAVASPVVPAEVFSSTPAKPAHPWFENADVPIVLAVGELSRRKDFATLIRAFSQLRSKRSARLLIAGKGGELENLRAQVDELKLTEDVEFLGFRDDVYSLMAHADVFAMTSRWEGLGFVLIEALACGTSCVAADCPSGPAEVLAMGQYGRLFPVGDDAALAASIEALLDAPVDPEDCRQAARRYEIESATEEYLQCLLP